MPGARRRRNTFLTGSLQAAEPETRDPWPFAFSQLDTPTRQEENEMSTTVLDAPNLGAGVDVEQLPCRREDPELFFAESPSDVELAKSLCGGCPVRAECLAGALERREPWGVWGGQLFIAGVVVPRKRPRGRPRKNAVAA
jgi:WhiB family redox-sensing transcriptional regulator